MVAETAGAAGPGRGGRMSGRRKRDGVLRLLRGEDLEMVSRSLGVTAATLPAWRDAFLAAGEASLASRPAGGEELESERLKARPGEMLWVRTFGNVEELRRALLVEGWYNRRRLHSSIGYRTPEQKAAAFAAAA